MNSKTVLKKNYSGLEEYFGFEIPTLIKTEKEMKKIADAIPENWLNDSTKELMLRICSLT